MKGNYEKAKSVLIGAFMERGGRSAAPSSGPWPHLRPAAGPLTAAGGQSGRREAGDPGVSVGKGAFSFLKSGGAAAGSASAALTPRAADGRRLKPHQGLSSL